MEEDIRELNEDMIKQVDQDIGILTPEDSEESLETTAVASCYVFTLYFPKERTAILAHLSASKSIGVFAGEWNREYPHLRKSVCEYTVIDGVYPTPFESQERNRDPEAIKQYFPKARPSPYHPLEVLTVLDIVSINKNTGVVKADG